MSMTFSHLKQSQLAEHVNVDSLSQLLTGDIEAVLELLSLFADYAPAMVDELRLAQESGDVTRKREAAHRFKGSCRQVGAEEIASLLFAIEEQPALSHADTVALIERQTNQLCAEIRTLG